MTKKQNELLLEGLFILFIIFISILSKRCNLKCVVFLSLILCIRNFSKKLYIIFLLLYLIILYQINNRKKTTIEKFESPTELYSTLTKILNIDVENLKLLIKGKNVNNISDLLVLNLDLNKTQRNRLTSYLEFSKIYLFDQILIFKLLNNQIPIYEIDKISENLDILDEKQQMGLNYYIFKTKIDDRYITILKNLNLYKYLDKTSVFYTADTLKDMYNMMILFNYYDLLGIREIIDEETLPNTFNLNFNVTEGIEGWVFKTLEKIKNHKWEDDIFSKYKIKQLASDKVDEIKNNYEYKYLEQDNVDFGKINSKDLTYNEIIKKYEKELFSNEYKTLEVLNTEVNKDNKDNKDNYDLLNNLGRDTSNTLLNILDDIIVLFSNIETNTTKNNLVDNYLFYFKNVLNIIFRDGRILYLGVLMIVLSMIMIFINITK